ncbi:MAG TPA: carbonic anhydrase [Candidatus Udaeobacter sp.]|nr:carbonic anhydrase [Candidatus Udaeobacter sp.]
MNCQHRPNDTDEHLHHCPVCAEDGENHAAAPDASRRRFLVGAITSTAASLLAGASAELTAPTPAAAQSTLTPQAALQAMMDGNQRYVEGRLQSLGEDLSILKQKTAEKQEPFGAVLSCADSRVPVELVFDQSIGHLFVTRVAGNIATSEIVASLEYGVAVLGTKVIMVLGHGNCGAVKATIQGKEVPGQISALYAPIQPAVDAAGPNLDAAIDANAKIQAALLREASPLIAGMVKDGTLMVVAARYDLASGKVTVLS